MIGCCDWGRRRTPKRRYGSERCEAPSALVFTFADATPASPERVLFYVEHHKKTVRLTPDGRLVVKIPTASTEPVF